MIVISVFIKRKKKKNNRDLKFGIPTPLNNIYKLFFCFFDKMDPDDHFPPKLRCQGYYCNSPWFQFLFSSNETTETWNSLYPKSYLHIFFSFFFKEGILNIPCLQNCRVSVIFAYLFDCLLCFRLTGLTFENILQGYFCISPWLPFLFFSIEKR